LKKKFGFNKTTKKLFVADAVKGLLISLVVGLPLLYLIALIYQELQSSFWLVGWLLVSAFSLFMFVFGTRIFLPMFNKLKPLPEGELRTAVEEYCQSQGFPLSKLWEMDASKRSTKLNAFFSGMGKVKIIGLYDTLIAKLTTQETVAVLAHEVGHYKRKHVYTMFAFSNVQTLVIFALMGWLLGNPNLSKALGSDTPSFHLSILAFFMLFTPVSTVLGLINNAFFSGMGKVKIIGLYDTLIAKLTTQETVAVLAHEVGHYKRKHVYTMFAFSNVQTLVIFALMGWLLGNPNLSKALGSDTPSFHLSILAFFMLFTPVSTVLGLINNSFSRHNEYQADQYSIDTYPGAREHMYSALKKLSVESLSNLNPHPVYVAVHYSHPPILDRLANLKK